MSNRDLGKMKDELCSTTKGDEKTNDTIIEACFLKAKVYCYTAVKCEEEKNLKGITKATIKDEITIKMLYMMQKLNM